MNPGPMERAISTILWILLLVGGAWGWQGVVVVLGLMALFEGWKWLRRTRELVVERNRPCEHGVRGAAAHGDLCSVCQEAAAREASSAAGRALEERQRVEAQLAADRARLLAQVRVPEFLRQVDPRAFELLVCRLYERMGYSVEPTRYVGDDGIDGFLRKDGQLTILQCKRTKAAVGAPILRDLLGAMHHEKADAAIVVTTGGVSQQARRWAAGTPIQIVELAELVDLLKGHMQEADIVPADFEVSGECACAKCGKPLRVVHGRRGRFLGCTGYPTCRYTRDIPRRSRNWRKAA